MQTHLSSALGRRTFIATLLTTLAASVAGCESPARFITGDTELQWLEFEYRRVGLTESILVRGVPDDSEAVFSIEGGAPAPLPADRIIVIPPGLSGRITVSVRWTRGDLLVRSGYRNETVDLDEKRHLANASA